jgi:hypothetical protein
LEGFIADITERKRDRERVQKTMDDLERLNRAMAGREDRILELKREVNDLLKQIGEPPRYGSFL